MKQLIWVTNGNKILRVLPDKIPNGFYKGRKFKPKKLKKQRFIQQYTLNNQLIAEYKSLREIERKLGIRHEYLSQTLSHNKHQYAGYNWYIVEWYE